MPKKHKRKRKATRPREGTGHSNGGPRARLETVVREVTIKQRTVSYRIYFDGELESEVPHYGGAQRGRAEKPNVTPGVTLKSGVRAVSNFGLSSDVAEAEGRAPFEEE